MSRQTKKIITELYDENGFATTDQDKILKRQVKYYKKKLWESTNPCDNDVKTYNKEIELPNITTVAEDNIVFILAHQPKRFIEAHWLVFYNFTMRRKADNLNICVNPEIER